MRARTVINEIKKSTDVRGSISVGRRALLDEWLRSLGLDPSRATLRGNMVDYTGDLDISGRGLTTLTSPDGFSFGNVGGSFWCDDNRLISLKGAPESVEEDFSCSENQLMSLEGATKNVRGNFSCSNNQLTSLEGAPKSVGGGFWCSYNQLTSLVGAPKSVGGGFWCTNNPVKFTEEEVRVMSEVKCNVYV
jgi:hypothetical protein